MEHSIICPDNDKGCSMGAKSDPKRTRRHRRRDPRRSTPSSVGCARAQADRPRIRSCRPLPDGNGRADEGAGPVRRDHRPGIWRPGAARVDLRQDHRSISAVWMSLTGIINSHLIMALAVEQFGTPEQKSAGCRGWRRARCAAASRLTEPDAGTDLQAIRRPRGAMAMSTSSTAPRPGSPTASTARASRCSSRPIPTPSRATTA